MCNFLKIYWGYFEKYEDQNTKFEKIVRKKKFEILIFYVSYDVH